MPTANINGIDLFYERIGNGAPLLLIHGLGSSGDDWAFQRDDFSRDYTLILPDLRGSGRSGKPPGPYAITQFAADLWALLDLLGVEYTNILGFSLGGSVALEMALERPAHVRRLILCNALADYRTNTWRKWLEAHAQITLVRTLGLRRTAQIVARRLFPREEQQPMRQRVVDVVGANPKTAYLATVRALIGWSALERLPEVHAPTLIIAAEHDYTPLAQRQFEITHFPRAEMTVIEGSRHGTPFDATERFNACVLDFLARDLADADVTDRIG
jgi:3-oxoadipate enol-lactonase